MAANSTITSAAGGVADANIGDPFADLPCISPKKVMRVQDLATEKGGKAKVVLESGEFRVYKVHNETYRPSQWLHAKMAELDCTGSGIFRQPWNKDKNKPENSQACTDFLTGSGLALQLAPFSWGWVRCNDEQWGNVRVRILNMKHGAACAKWAAGKVVYTDFNLNEAKPITSWKGSTEVSPSDMNFAARNDIQLNIIPNLEPRHLVKYNSQQPDEQMLFNKPEGSHYVCFFIQVDTVLFKKCVYQKFANGAWAGIKNPDTNGNLYGQMWISPTFTYQQLHQYYAESFDANVSVGKLMMGEVMPTPSPSDEPY
mmetsp:Transcript_46560/g.76946  ORF Transcript_46560/g.76946 Transcript_46560/m.76946 type:complete len:313 (-) Transcript_46560:126-1064(-)